MCFALIRVKYRTEASATLMEVSDETELNEKLTSLTTAVNVIKVEVFRRQSSMERVEMWKNENGDLAPVETRA
jgi:molybdopterin-guanine dinucleotide biosynthesis protein